jgi:hypothetical protein
MKWTCVTAAAQAAHVQQIGTFISPGQTVGNINVVSSSLHEAASAYPICQPSTAGKKVLLYAAEYTTLTMQQERGVQFQMASDGIA